MNFVRGGPQARNLEYGGEKKIGGIAKGPVCAPRRKDFRVGKLMDDLLASQ